MSKEEYLAAVKPMFDAAAHYNGAGNRSFTDTERFDFFEKLYAFIEANRSAFSAPKLALALIATQGRFSCCQDQAAKIITLL